MKSTKVQNPRRMPRIDQASAVIGHAWRCSRTTRSVLAVTRASCIGMGKAEPATRPSKRILHDALNGQSVAILRTRLCREVGHELLRMRNIYN